TARGYKALVDRTVDIAMASGAVPDEVAIQLAGRQRTLYTTLISTDAVVPLVHASNPVSRLSLRQLTNIFSGRIRNWKEAGGADAPIHVLVGPPGGGVTRSFVQLVLGEDATFTPSRSVLDTGKRLRQVAGDPCAITFVAMMPFDQRALKIVTVDGLQANASMPATALRVPMILAVAGAQSGAARDFIAYAGRQWNFASEGGSGRE
ncbi:MAG: substrate-binding domain-containing protein, partial [Massilia sp.]